MTKCLLLTRLFAICLPLLICTSYSNGQEWERVAINDSASVELFGEVIKKKVKGHFTFYCKDEIAIYSIVVKDGVYDGNPIDSELKRFYDGALQGIANVSGKGEVFGRNDFTVENFSGIEAQYTTPEMPQLPKTKIVRLLLANGTFYSLSAWTNFPDDPDFIAIKNRYFSSFRTGVKKTPPVGPETQTSSYKIGALMGKVFFFGALAVGFFALISRLSNRKQ